MKTISLDEFFSISVSFTQLLDLRRTIMEDTSKNPLLMALAYSWNYLFLTMQIENSIAERDKPLGKLLGIPISGKPHCYLNFVAMKLFHMQM